MSPRVTFGFVNCNRLHYLRSCVESVLECTSDYPDLEFIIVDNASVEEGTDEYLRQKEDQGFRVVRQFHRDPQNEFARGLNTVVRLATGEFVCPLQADMQFVVKGQWLKRYVDFCRQNLDIVGCMTLDAQRRSRIAGQRYERTIDPMFVWDLNRNPVCGAGDVLYSRKILDLIMPWSESNLAHEGGNDSETAMLKKVREITGNLDMHLRCVSPTCPVSVAIYTDARGTNARVRGNKRYGDYWPPKDSYKYYQISDFIEPLGNFHPASIEDVARPIGWKAPVDNRGNWLKNPIKPELASESDYVILSSSEPVISVAQDRVNDYVDEWLDS